MRGLVSERQLGSYADLNVARRALIRRAGDGLPCSRRHLLNVPRPLRRGVPRG